jgi:hypothetical protein
MKSREAILLAKMGNKKRTPSQAYDLDDIEAMESAMSQENDGRDFRGVKNGVKDAGPQISAKTGGSMDILKAHKASGGAKMPSANIADLPQAKTYDQTESPVMKAKIKPYSPIQNYLRKGR